jgi:high-affinity iron transporter
MLQSFGSAPLALTGALLGLAVAVVVGWMLARGAVRLDTRRFFAWTGGFLVIVAAGVLAYAIMDLQEAGALAGPFSPEAPIDAATGAVAVGWAAFPFGWAFDVSAAIAPDSAGATLLQATVGFRPEMSWLQVVVWALYVLIVGFFFLRGIRTRRPARPAATVAAETGSAAPTLTQQGAA